MLVVLIIAIAGGAVIGAFAVSTDTLGAGHLFERAMARIDRFIAGPVPDRPTDGRSSSRQPGHARTDRDVDGHATRSTPTPRSPRIPR
jgi:hypothetical protein